MGSVDLAIAFFVVDSFRCRRRPFADGLSLKTTCIHGVMSDPAIAFAMGWGGGVGLREGGVALHGDRRSWRLSVRLVRVLNAGVR